VATPEGRKALASKVQEHLDAGMLPVLVVSAMGRRGEPYATDTLIDTVAGLPTRDREYDLLTSVGEVISAVKIAHELRGQGIEAQAFTGAEAGIVTDDTAKDARILSVCPATLITAAEQGIVPVVCGFQGISTSGHLTTLGRGGSDTTACALGVALDAAAVEIYSDVDGVMTADPREVEAARVIDVLQPDELYQLVRMGSRIVHTPAAELAQKSGVNLLVKNTYSNHSGTVVRSMEVHKNSEAATAIAGKSGITRFIVDLGREEGCAAHIEAQARIYKAVADAGVSLDMFTPAGSNLYFTVDSSEADNTVEVLRELGVSANAMEGLAKVTIIGAAMHGVPGVMSRIATPLAQAGIDVWQTADSHATISVLVRETESQQAQIVLHTAFGLDQ
jgi:aspartate kinase